MHDFLRIPLRIHKVSIEGCRPLKVIGTTCACRTDSSHLGEAHIDRRYRECPCTISGHTKRYFASLLTTRRLSEGMAQSTKPVEHSQDFVLSYSAQNLMQQL
jgi:hypothetical protein